MRNTYEATAQHEETFEARWGYEITVTMWSDNTWTAYIARPERVHGAEHVIMDNDIEWEERPDESDLHDYIDSYLDK